jgi:hypothetical protein
MVEVFVVIQNDSYQPTVYSNEIYLVLLYKKPLYIHAAVQPL